MPDVTPVPDLAPIERLSTRTGVTEGSPKYDALKDALTSASDRFRGQVGHQVHQVTETLRVKGTGGPTLILPVWHITEIVDVLVDGVPVEVDWDETGCVDRRRGTWPRRRRAVELTVTHGFDPIPGWIADVVLEQAEEQFNNTPGVSSKQVGGISTSYDQKGAAGVTAQWTAAVLRYGTGMGDHA